MQNILVIYHRNDFDGIVSGCITETSLKEKFPNADIKSIGWDYGETLPDYTYNQFDSIFIVDLSVDSLMQNKELQGSIIWIDHHKTAIEKYKDIRFGGLQLDGVAACRLCWQYFEGNPNATYSDYYERKVSEPLIVRLAGEYDVWDKRDRFADGLQFALRSLEKSVQVSYIKNALTLDDYNTIEFAAQGLLIKSYVDIQNASLVSTRSHDVDFEGLNFICFNGYGNSLTVESAVKSHHDGIMLWSYNGKCVTISLYGVKHHPEHDLSLIAKKYGGGGHKQACGFRVSLSDLSKMI